MVRADGLMDNTFYCFSAVFLLLRTDFFAIEMKYYELPPLTNFHLLRVGTLYLVLALTCS